MKVVILAGGLPSTIDEENEKKPKPMAEIGGRPILWHIMKQYSAFGYNDFIICTGYKGEMIKDYFMNFYIYQSDITVNLQTNHVDIHRKKTEDWNVSVMDTGLNSTITERIMTIRRYLEDDPYFLVAYGDCVSDISIQKLVEQHLAEQKLVTMAVSRPTGRNQILPINEDGHMDTEKKPRIRDAWVNACNLVFSAEIFQYLNEGKFFLEEKMMDTLGRDGRIGVYRHEGFWSPMETFRDRHLLETMWNHKQAPWKIWQD